jgi:phenylpyruvate tautomerase PptA (4-oxalocrotonate tautomerase family)
MPILFIEAIEDPSLPLPEHAAQSIADAVGLALGTPPARTWVRLRRIPQADYAENAAPDAPAPLFVNLRLRQPPAGAARAEQVQILTTAIASACGRRPEQVHVYYEPAAAGQQAFGGRLV